MLYVDRMRSRSFMTVDNLARYWNDLPIAAVNERLGI
jgi:hypothetical protein